MGDLFLSDDFLSDDPPPRRSRPRWVDGLGLVAVVLGIVAIGVLGDRGSVGRSPTPTTTTSTTSPFRRGTPYASTTTTTGAPIATTTTLVQQLEGHIAVTTGALVLVSTGSTLTLVDVDAGTARRLPSAGGFGLIGLDEGFVVPVGGAIRLIPGDGGPLVDLPLPEPTFESRLLRAGPHSVWAFDGPGDTTSATEIDASGHPTGGHVELPTGIYVTGAVDGGVVANARGGIVFVDGRTGKARSLGTGDAVAERGRSMVRLTCVLLRCRTEVVDVVTARSRAVPVPDVFGTARQSELSPDGRWLAASYSELTGVQHLLVVDLRTGRWWTGDGLDSQAPITFSPGSDVVFTTSSGSLCAFELATSNRSCLDGLQAGQVGEIAAAPRR